MLAGAALARAVIAAVTLRQNGSAARGVWTRVGTRPYRRGLLNSRWRLVRNECGLETVEAVALIGVLLALLTAVLVLLRGQGGNVGHAAVAALVRMLNGAFGAAPSSATLTATAPDTAIQTAVLGVPAALETLQLHWRIMSAAAIVLALSSAAAASIAAMRSGALQAFATQLHLLNAQAGAPAHLPPWLTALGKVLLGVVVGVVALVALAGLIYLGAAVLAAVGIGAGITVAAALVIAGVVLAVAFVAWEFWTRLQTFREVNGEPTPWEIAQLVGVSVLNLFGVVSIYEAITGRQALTGVALAGAERWERGIGGALQVLLTFVGVRAGLRGLFRRSPRNVERPAPAPAEPAPGNTTPSEPAPTGRLSAYERLAQLREQQRLQRLREAIREAEANGALDELPPHERNWLNADSTGRRKELAYDPDTKSFKVQEARVALQAEADRTIPGPVRRDFDLSGQSQGGDVIDGSGTIWDIKDARAGIDRIIQTASPRRGRPGENVLVDVSGLTPAERAAFETEIRRRLPPGLGRVVLVPHR